MNTPTTARIEALWLRPAARLPVQSVAVATAVAGQGLAGDHAGGGNRQLTLLDVDAWRAACAQFGRDVDPAVRRANVLIAGLDLRACRGATLQLGPEVQIVVVGETRQCELLDDGGRIGLCASLRPDGRGGVYGRIVRGGSLRVGDPLRSLPPDVPPDVSR